jgi:hypothetical protein
MRRRTLLVALAGLAVVVAGGAVVLWPRANRVTRENYDRIQIGMSRADVEAVLGPPGLYASGPLMVGGTVYSDDVATVMGGERMEEVDWTSDNAIVRVFFRLTGQVGDKCFTEASRMNQTPVDNLLWRARRQWHRWFP